MSMYSITNGVDFVLSMQFLSIREIRKVKAPTLLLSGLADQLIPPAMMSDLYQVHTFTLLHVTFVLSLKWIHVIKENTILMALGCVNWL